MSPHSFSKIVVVPGIMGSELRLRELGPNKVLLDRLVWAEDINVIWQTLAQKPSCLSSEDIRPGKVLRYLKGFPLPRPKPVYGPLLDYLRETYNLEDEKTLLAFGYDWRQCNFRSATKLGEFLREHTDGDDRVVFIAHSMGGLICRALLANGDFADIWPRVTKLIQLGTPLLGSAKAYFSLKNYIQLNSAFDLILSLNQRWHPQLYHQLYSSLSRFAALFQLLPPTREQVVFDEAGMQYSALDTSLWPNEVHDLLAGATALHDLVGSISLDNIYSLYSTDLQTDRAYLIDAGNMVKAVCLKVNGDGTVSVASASTATLEGNRMVFSNIGHDRLPRSRTVFRALNGLL